MVFYEITNTITGRCRFFVSGKRISRAAADAIKDEYQLVCFNTYMQGHKVRRYYRHFAHTAPHSAKTTPDATRQPETDNGAEKDLQGE